MIFLVLLRASLPPCPLQTEWLLPLTEGLLPQFDHSLLLCEEVSCSKTINIKQYLNTNNFSVDNRHFVIKSSHATQLYIAKIFYKQFSCHDYIKNPFSSEILIKLTLSDSVKSPDYIMMQHDTSDILFSLFKMTFNLFKNSVVLSKFKKNHYLSEILIK